MCAFIKPSMSFAIKSVTPAQKGASVSSEPTLIAASTVGKFTLSPSAGIALSLKPGDSLGFCDNLMDIINAVNARQPEVVASFEENGFDINNEADVATFVKEMYECYIFKGYDLYEANGERAIANVRTSKEEKEKMLADNYDKVYAEAYDAIVAAIKTNKGEDYEPTEDEVKEYVTIDLIPSKKEPAVYGSKLNTTSNQTGYGLTLSCTDNNIWNRVKNDLTNDVRESSKRVFKVDTKNPVKRTFNDGYKDVEVNTYLITDAVDEEVSRGNKD